jgi:hypothetical protein
MAGLDNSPIGFYFHWLAPKNGEYHFEWGTITFD